MRLFALPYAGASASAYNRWTIACPPALELRPLELPGRGQRQMQQLPTSLVGAAADIADAIRSAAANEPFAIFGHSLGALVAYEVVQRFRATNGPGPVHLLLSGCRPPHAVEADVKRTSDLSDSEFKAALAALGGLPEEILEHPRIFKKLIRVVRADYALIETYKHLHQVPSIPCPLTVFSGQADREASPEKMAEWFQYTDRTFKHHVFEGGHFFLMDGTESMLAHICASLGIANGS